MNAAAVTAALGFALLDTRGQPVPPKVQTVRRWLDSWTGVGHVVTGMQRQDYDIELTRHHPLFEQLDRPLLRPEGGSVRTGGRDDGFGDPSFGAATRPHPVPFVALADHDELGAFGQNLDDPGLGLGLLAHVRPSDADHQMQRSVRSGLRLCLLGCRRRR